MAAPKYLVLVMLLLGLNACSLLGGDKDTPEPRESPQPAPLPKIESPIELDRLWSSDIGSSITGGQELLGLRPALWGNHLYAVDGGGKISALDASTGKQIWRRDSNVHVTAGPGVGDGLLAVGTDEGEVLAFSTKSGELLWETSISSEILAPPLIVSNTVIARTLDGKLFALSAESGRNLWVYSDTVPALTRHGTSAPVAHEGIVLAGLDSGKLVAIELSSGRQLWEIAISSPSGTSELERMVDIDAELKLHKGEVIAVALHGQIALINVLTGRIGWTQALSSYTEAAVDDSGVYLTDELGKITALDRSSGELLWEQDLLQHRHLSAPTVFAEYVLCGDNEGHLYWLDRSEGRLVGQVRLGAGIYTAPQTSPDAVFVYAKNGVISAFALK